MAFDKFLMFATTLFLLLGFISISEPTTAATPKNDNNNTGELNNVLVILSDDLSPFHLDPNHPAKMKNVDRLATRGIKFLNAQTSFPVCGPSRMSFMTGRYAESTKLFTFERYVMQVPGLKTVAQYMAKTFGYETAAFGKVFHEDHSASSAVVKAMYQAGFWTNKQFGGGSEDNECGMNWFCTLKMPSKSGDWKLAHDFVSYLQGRKHTETPLLAFLGFRKPHLDVAVPNANLQAARSATGKDFLTSSEPPSINATGGIVPFKKSLQRFECYFEIANRKVNGRAAYPADRFLNSTNSKDIADIRSHYFAALSFVDENIGHVVDYVLNDPKYRDNTAIIYFADHGFSMGEHGMFCKNALFEQQTRVPLIVVPANNDEKYANRRGRVRTDPVSLVDVFPTVVELGTGVSLGHKAKVDESSLPLDGRSVLHETASAYAFSQYPRCADVSAKSNWQCVIASASCKRIPNKYMGFAVRVAGKKYVEWRPFADVFTKCERPKWPNLTAKLRSQLKMVQQIDAVRTGTRWDKLPVQREYFTDYEDNDRFTWGDWEHANQLVERIHDSKTVADAIELSAAIKWRFDPSFSEGSPEQPCSGNGYVKLRNRTSWTDFSRDPTRADVECSCLAGWTGPLCDRPK